MEKLLILRSHANDVFNAVRAAGLDPTDFVWEITSSSNRSEDQVSILRHRSTGAYFTFDFAYGDEHRCQYYPGGEGPFPRKESTTTWLGQLEAVKSWLSIVAKEAAPDLWATAAGEPNLTASAMDDTEDNTLFSEDERVRISQSLNEILDYMRTAHQLEQHQLAAIEGRLRYLQQASERLGRKDWINMAIGVLTSIVVQVALPQDAARDLLRFAAKVLEWVIRSGPALLS